MRRFFLILRISKVTIPTAITTPMRATVAAGALTGAPKTTAPRAAHALIRIALTAIYIAPDTVG